MARNYYYFALLILIWMQKSVDAINFKDIHDINSIKKFIQGITDRTPADYNLGKVLSNSEKSKIIVDDFEGILNDLDDLDDNTSNVTRDFVESLKVFNKRTSEYKNQTILELMDHLRAFNNIINRINLYADNLINLRYDFGYNLVNYCSAVLNLMRSIALEDQQDILNEYHIIEDRWWKIYQQDTNMPFSRKLFSTPCGKRLLIEQLHYKFYRQMVTYYLKEYVIRYYLEIINSQCPHHNLTNTRIDKFIFMSKIKEKITPMALRHSNFDFLYRCDPPNYDNNDGETYYKLSTSQTVIVKEEDLDLNQSCSHNCNLWYIHDSINNTECDRYQECRYIDSSYEICEPPASDHSSRRYQWFKDGHENVYGDNSTECKTPVKKVSSTLWVSKLRSCDYCLCTCIKKKPSREDDVLFVSFREQVTDIKKNMVIVGVRFVKKNNMIHVQIKEAELKPYGLTGKSRWKELEDFSYNKSTESFYVRHFNGSQILLKEDVDYGRPFRMNVEDLVAPPGFVITGVAFQCSKEPTSEGGCFRLQELKIRVTPFDYFEGRLIKNNRTYWYTHRIDSFLGPMEVPLDNSDLPTKSPMNRVDWRYGNYVEFQRTDLSKDAGQSTIPFFDAQDVEGELEFPLGTIGVFHRGHKGYGGFLAFKIQNINVAHNFKVTFNTE